MKLTSTHHYEEVIKIPFVGHPNSVFILLCQKVCCLNMMV